MAKRRFLQWQLSAILNFMGAIMGSLKSPCRTSYRSSTETIACLVFEKFAFLCMDHGDRRMDRRTNRRTASIHKGASRYRGTSKCIGDDTNATARQSLNCNKNKNKIKYGEKRFSIWRMELLHPVMWHDHGIDFAR